MHTLRFFPSVSLGYGGKFFGWPVPSLAKDVRAGGAPSSVGGSVGTGAGPDLRRGSPPGPGRERGGVLRTLRVVGAFPVPRGAAPRGPRLPGGGPHFSREMGRKRAGAPPLDPGFLWPLVATRWFLGSLSLVRSRGYFLRYAKTDLGRIFRKNMPKSIFAKNSPQIRARTWAP